MPGNENPRIQSVSINNQIGKVEIRSDEVGGYEPASNSAETFPSLKKAGEIFSSHARQLSALENAQNVLTLTMFGEAILFASDIIVHLENLPKDIACIVMAGLIACVNLAITDTTYTEGRRVKNKKKAVDEASQSSAFSLQRKYFLRK